MCMRCAAGGAAVMVGFGEKIAEQHYHPWAENYIQYADLKKLIDDILAVG